MAGAGSFSQCLIDFLTINAKEYFKPSGISSRSFKCEEPSLYFVLCTITFVLLICKMKKPWSVLFFLFQFASLFSQVDSIPHQSIDTIKGQKYFYNGEYYLYEKPKI